MKTFLEILGLVPNWAAALITAVLTNPVIWVVNEYRWRKKPWKGDKELFIEITKISEIRNIRSLQETAPTSIDGSIGDAAYTFRIALDNLLDTRGFLDKKLTTFSNNLRESLVELEKYSAEHMYTKRTQSSFYTLATNDHDEWNSAHVRTLKEKLEHLTQLADGVLTAWAEFDTHSRKAFGEKLNTRKYPYR
jgi:hypothetical protein